MTLIMVQFIAVILAALGLDTIATLNNNSRWQKKLIYTFWVAELSFSVFNLVKVFSAVCLLLMLKKLPLSTKNALAQLESLKTMRP
jgi:hypothetical protein